VAKKRDDSALCLPETLISGAWLDICQKIRHPDFKTSKLFSVAPSFFEMFPDGHCCLPHGYPPAAAAFRAEMYHSKYFVDLVL
jgi:hypothetical protein